MDIAGEEFKKVVKTNGTSRIERIGPWLPGFNLIEYKILCQIWGED